MRRLHTFANGFSYSVEMCYFPLSLENWLFMAILLCCTCFTRKSLARSQILWKISLCVNCIKLIFLNCVNSLKLEGWFRFPAGFTQLLVKICRMGESRDDEEAASSSALDPIICSIAHCRKVTSYVAGLAPVFYMEHAFKRNTHPHLSVSVRWRSVICFVFRIFSFLSRGWSCR